MTGVPPVQRGGRRPHQLRSQLQLSRGLRLLLRLILAKIDDNENRHQRAGTNLAPTTLALLIEQLGMKQDRVAVELNRDIVPRSKWAETNLSEGDRLEIVHFVGGGFS